MVVLQSQPSDKSIGFESFRIAHYAGQVLYCVDGFLDKNKDHLFQDFKRLLYNRSAMDRNFVSFWFCIQLSIRHHQCAVKHVHQATHMHNHIYVFSASQFVVVH